MGSKVKEVKKVYPYIWWNIMQSIKKNVGPVTIVLVLLGEKIGG